MVALHIHHELAVHPGRALGARFEAGEPICHIFPVSRGGLEAVTPDMRKLSENPELEGEYKAWSDSRNSFNKGLNDPNSDAVREKWQKLYFRGVCRFGRNGPEDHRSRLKLKPFG
ncbi:hypothetical protein SM0020_17612 [Sinorhizobium meliloti CCNWSX0020]|uniref:Uncharacterized protein n=2 Tax=Rhizobium meliloti TaxID=382 RepID=H0G214_RHIML|nr:DUF6065 family protein [Sinorhizobium meliloti]EHK76652.1 hypothetical protein SM0020_17612 [Sinorhizobium meliloti CCNWSX0020]